ncbi:MAG: DUF354 domain-containing protein [Thermoanaerobaculia bacterium]|nr:DUF354 domain-containing protein [Thermoanaerobaculia bacterium]
MRILVDITHPAHVHFFRHAIGEWRHRGHVVYLTSRRKDLATQLLDQLGLEHDDLGRAREGIPGLILELGSRTLRLLRRVRQFQPDVMTAIGGVWIAQASWMRGVPSVVFYDTEHATLSNLLTYPFCTVVATPSCYEGRVPAHKHRVYSGYQELAYTHPRRFKANAAIVSAIGLDPEERYIFLRLVSWAASHDVGDHGITQLLQCVQELQLLGRVVISSEASLPAALEPLRIVAGPEQIHHILACASLYIGESATMASESATLGTPAILISTSVRGYTNEQETRYGLTYTFSNPETAQEEALEKARELMGDPETAVKWQRKRQEMLDRSVDVTDYIVELVESCGEEP